MRIAHTSMLASAAVLAFVLGGSALAKGLAAPTISSVSPTAGARGAVIAIYGENLQHATVTFTADRGMDQGSTSGAVTAAPIEPASISPDGTQLTVNVPDGGDTSNGVMAPGGEDRITVTTPEGSASTTFKVLTMNTLGMKPVITLLMPHHAAPGAQVTIFGHHFSGATMVKLAGMKAAFKIPSDSRMVAIVPKNAHSGSWMVKTARGTAVSAGRFTVTGATT